MNLAQKKNSAEVLHRHSAHLEPVENLLKQNKEQNPWQQKIVKLNYDRKLHQKLK